MRLSRAVTAVLILAAACGTGDDPGSGRGGYPAQLARVSGNAHIQERGLARALRIRLEHAGSGEERLAALVVYVDQSARLYQDVVDALGQLDPPGGTASAQDAYIEAWQSQLDLVIAVRDAGFRGPIPFLEALDAPAFDDAVAETRARCEALQAALGASGSKVDLDCDGRPS